MRFWLALLVCLFASSVEAQTTIQWGKTGTNPWAIGIIDGAQAFQPYFNQPSTGGGGKLLNAAVPNPTVSSLGGIEALASATSHQWLQYVDTSGVQHLLQPGVGDLSGLGTNVSTALGNTLNGAGGLLSNLSAGASGVELFTSGVASVGPVPNSSLANTGWTINGVPMVLGGGPYSITAVATSVTPGTTGIVSGTTNGLLYDNAGTLGNLATANSGVLVTSGSGVPSISTTLPSALTIPSPTISGTLSGTPTWASSQAITLSTAAQPNVTSVGTLTALNVGGSTTSPTVDGQIGLVQNGTKTASSIYSPYAVSSGVIFDAFRSVFDFEGGTNMNQAAALAGYIYNNTSTSAYPNAKNAVAVQGFAVANQNNSATWGADFACADNPSNTSGAYTGRTCFGVESDVTIQSSSGGSGTIANGFVAGLQGSGAPANAIAFQTISANPNGWTFGALFNDDTVATAILVGLEGATSGASISSQPVAFHYTDSGSSEHATSLYIDGFGGLNVKSNALTDWIEMVPGSGGNVSIDAQGTGNVNINLVPLSSGAVISNGSVEIPNGNAFLAKNAAGSGLVSLIYDDTSNIIQIAHDGNAAQFGGQLSAVGLNSSSGTNSFSSAASDVLIQINNTGTSGTKWQLDSTNSSSGIGFVGAFAVLDTGGNPRFVIDSSNNAHFQGADMFFSKYVSCTTLTTNSSGELLCNGSAP